MQKRYKYNPYFWMDYYWNRFLCLFSLHIWIYLPEKHCYDEDDVPGEIICACCSKKP
jgi:hypothetical protein